MQVGEDAILREVIEDEEEVEDGEHVNIDYGNLGMCVEVGEGGGGVGGGRQGKRKREVNWARHHACVGASASLTASIKGFKSLGRMGGGVTLLGEGGGREKTERKGVGGQGSGEDVGECEEGEERWSRGMPGRAGARVRESAASSSLTAVLMSINQASRAQHRGGASSEEI